MPVWWVYLFFTQPHTPQDGVGWGKGQLQQKYAQKLPGTPILLREEDRVLTSTHRPCLTCGCYLPVLPPPSLPLLHSVPARGASSMFLQLTRQEPTSGPLHRLFSLPRECSSPSTCIVPPSLLKCYLLSKALPDLSISILITHPPLPLPSPLSLLSP